MREEGKLNNLLAFVVTILLVTSCSSDVQDLSENSSTATFDVTTISAVKIDDIGAVATGDWSEIPAKRNITFRACLNDVTLQVPLQNQTVSVTGPNGTKERTTDSAGCTTWSDDFDFSYFAQEKLVEYPIAITGLSGHMGHEEIKLMVNPWNKDTSKVVYDTRYDELPVIVSDLEADTKTPIVHLRNLSIRYVQSGYNREQHFAYYSYRFSGNVEGRRLDTKGNPRRLLLQKGKFQIEMDLIEERQGEYSKISHTAFTAEMNDGVINKDVQFNFMRGFQHHPESRFYVSAKLNPIGLPVATHNGVQNNQLSQEGIIPLANLQGANQGSLDAIQNYPEEMLASQFKTQVLVKETQEFIVPEEETEFKTTEVEDEFASTEELESNDESLSDNFGVSITSVRLTNGVLLRPEDESSNSRIKRMPITICLADGLSQNSNKPLPMTKVSFRGKQRNQLDTMEKREATTDQRGCFQSYILLSYDYLGCERFEPFTYEVEVVDGRYSGLKKTAKLAINPYNPGDLFYDLRLASAPPAIECTSPEIAISSFTYKNLGTDRDSFKVNRHLHLSLAKRFSLEFTPKFYRNGAYQEVENHKSLFAGSFDMTLSVLSPKVAHANFFEFNEQEWDYLTSMQTEVTVNSNGMISKEVTLPFHLSETLFLSYKNLLIVKLTPKDGTNLKQSTFMMPFHATAQAGTFTPVYMAEQVSENLNEKIEMGLKLAGKIPGLHKAGALSEARLAEKPINLYRQKYRKISENRETPTTLLYGNKDFFNNLPPLAKSSWDEVSASEKRNFHTTLTDSDIRTLTGYAGQKTDRLLKKFCRGFYSIDREKNKLSDCLNQPKDFIRVTTMAFVDDILGQKDREVNDTIYHEAKAKFVNDDQGKIRRGNAFFAAYGDRSSISTGERDSVSYNTNMSYGLEGPGMVFMGFSQNRSVSQEVYKVKNSTQMKAAFNRNYTSRDMLDLTFERLTLEIPVKKLACITVESIQTRPVAYQICDSRARLQRLKETWFFVGDTNAQRHGVISDGNLPGDTNQNQVIRGQFRFNQLWDDMEKEDTLLVIKELGSLTPGDAFDSYVNRGNNLLPYESKYDHAFPGMILPFTHAPTNSCTDCQDQ